MAESSSSECALQKIIGYFGGYNNTLPPETPKVEIRDIDATKLTHLIYWKASVDKEAAINIPNGSFERKDFKQLSALKKTNPRLKTLLSIGGWNMTWHEEQSGFFIMSAEFPIIKKFAKNALAIIKKHKFDGIDIDWQDPCNEDMEPPDKIVLWHNTIEILKETRKVFDKNAPKFGPKYLLTALINAQNPCVDLHDRASLLDFTNPLDFLSLATFNYNVPKDIEIVPVGHNAPMYLREGDVKNECISLSVNPWLNKDDEIFEIKIVLGIAFFGRAYTILPGREVAVGKPGRIDRSKRIMSYRQINYLKNQPGWHTLFDENQKTCSLSRGQQWITFDDEKSIDFKWKYAKETGLAGIMIWCIEADDYTDQYGPRFPLLTYLKAKQDGSLESSSSFD